MEPQYFASAAEFRDWLAEHHDRATELLAGFHKKASGIPSMTWPESVDAALCFGWIDGVRKNVDVTRYTIRFTPRKRSSVWSAINIRRAGELTRSGLMHPAGLAAFEARSEMKSRIYAYEQGQIASFGPILEKEFRAHAKAWTFFQAQPPGYRKLNTWRVVSAKREETRMKRLALLIQASEDGRRIE